MDQLLCARPMLYSWLVLPEVPITRSNIHFFNSFLHLANIYQGSTMYVSQAKDIAAAKHIKIIVPEVLLSGEQMKRNKTDRENKCLVVRNQMRNKNKNNQKK